MTIEIISQPTKICTKCNIYKCFSMFSKHSRSKDKKKSHCKACVKIYNDKTKVHISERGKRYREKNKEKIAKEKKEWARTHKENRRIICKKYRDNNKDKLAEYNKNHREQKKEYYKEYKKAYGLTEKAKVSAVNYSNKRRSIKRRLSDGTLPQEVKYPLTKELQDLLILQNNKCYICNKELTEKHLDHHVPISKGGTHSIENVVWLCPLCNLQKGTKLPKTLLLI